MVGACLLARQPQPGQVPPVKQPVGIERYEGLWVAILDDDVIAYAPTSRELATKLKGMGPRGQEATVRFVKPPVAGYVVGVG